MQGDEQENDSNKRERNRREGEKERQTHKKKDVTLSKSIVQVLRRYHSPKESPLLLPVQGQPPRASTATAHRRTRGRSAADGSVTARPLLCLRPSLLSPPQGVHVAPYRQSAVCCLRGETRPRRVRTQTQEGNCADRRQQSAKWRESGAPKKSRQNRDENPAASPLPSLCPLWARPPTEIAALRLLDTCLAARSVCARAASLPPLIRNCTNNSDTLYKKRRYTFSTETLRPPRGAVSSPHDPLPSMPGSGRRAAHGGEHRCGERAMCAALSLPPRGLWRCCARGNFHQ